MDIGALVRILVRRWYVVVPGLLATLFLAVYLPSTIEPDWTVDGALLFVGPTEREVNTADGGVDIEDRNPLLELGGLGTNSEALGVELGSQRIRAEFAAEGFEPGYEIGVDSRTPIMELLVESDDQERVESTMEALMVWVETKVDERQVGFNDANRLSVERLSYGNAPSAGYTSQTRAQMLLLASGLLGTVLLAVLVDLLRSRGDVAPPESDLGADTDPSGDGDDGGVTRLAAHDEEPSGKLLTARSSRWSR